MPLSVFFEAKRRQSIHENELPVFVLKRRDCLRIAAIHYIVKSADRIYMAEFEKIIDLKRQLYN